MHSKVRSLHPSLCLPPPLLFSLIFLLLITARTDAAARAMIIPNLLVRAWRCAIVDQGYQAGRRPPAPPLTIILTRTTDICLCQSCEVLWFPFLTGQARAYHLESSPQKDDEK